MAFFRTLKAGAALLVVALLAGCSEHRTVSQEMRNNLSELRGNPEILAAYQAWFGKPGHINVGYSSLDPAELTNQIQKAKDLGIAAFVVNWYGEGSQFEDRSYALLQQLAAQNNFYTALLYDESENPQHSTDDAIRDFQYAYERYIGPNAPSRNAYLTFDGRPLIFIFPKGGHTDWKRVRAALSDWQSPPLLLEKDIRTNELDDFDGFYAWVHPTHGWRSGEREDWGEGYLEDFYSRMSSRYPDKLAVGGAWPGFNDRKASWSQNRYMDPRCGKTFADSLRLFRRYYTTQHPLPFLMIDTWNDYEEGTAIERGIDTCTGSVNGE
jgi:hypothetical protein